MCTSICCCFEVCRNLFHLTLPCVTWLVNDSQGSQITGLPRGVQFKDMYVWSIRPDVDRCVVLVRVVPAGHPVRGVRVEYKT